MYNPDEDDREPAKKQEKPYIWDLAQAVSLIRLLQSSAEHCGYFLCLGGGVLNKGFSTHDLDIVASEYTEKRGTNADKFVRLIPDLGWDLVKVEMHGRHSIAFYTRENYKLEVWFPYHHVMFDKIWAPE